MSQRYQFSLFTLLASTNLRSNLLERGLCKISFNGVNVFSIRLSLPSSSNPLNESELLMKVLLYVTRGLIAC